MEEKTLKSNLFLYCNYVYGIGHLIRSLELCKGLVKDYNVYLLSGGEPVPNLDICSSINFIQLPALFKKEKEVELIPVDQDVSLSECFAKRQVLLDQWVREVKPDIIIMEHFPFGLLFEKESLHLIDSAKEYKQNLKLVCSVREVIESPIGGPNDDRVCHILNKHFDLILVHGDERVIPISQSFPRIDNIRIPVKHTGYIVAKRIIDTVSPDKKPVLLASVAGGRLGAELLEAVIESHKRLVIDVPHQVIIFTGAFQKQAMEGLIEDTTGESNEIRILQFDRGQYLQYLSSADVVITLGGYNSTLESISFKKKILIYDRDFAGTNREQNLRIRSLEDKGFLKTFTAEDISNERLSEMISNAITCQSDPVHEINLNGVERSRGEIIQLFR
jgi:predicted glycosyltransferase